MTAKHTPGPWNIHWGTAQSGSGHHIVDGTDHGELSRIATVLFHDDAEGETNANARLIAAAPDLLEAVDRLLTWNTGGQRAEDVSFARQAYANAVGLSANT